MNVDEATYSYPNNLIMPANPSGTNWWDEVFGPAFVQDYNIGVSGGTDNANYNVSFNYLDQEGTAIHNYYRRGSVRVNTQFNAGRFTIGENIALSIAETVGGIPDLGGYVENTIVGKNILLQPIVPVYDVGGYFAGGKANTLGNTDNPVAVAYKGRNNTNANRRIVGSVLGSLL
jgi:TonB-dependent starch-binding outer membrane protein SusC